MKNSILGSLIGLSIVLSIDSVSRVLAALIFDQQILMFSYTGYPGMATPILLTLMAAISTFLGGLFAFTYGKSRQVVSLLLFLVLIIFLRYGQVHLLYTTEGIVYPIIGLILSILAIFLAWKLVRPSKNQEKAETFKHHSPAAPDEDM